MAVYAMGANAGSFTSAPSIARHQAPQIAIEQAYKNGLLGKNLFEKGFDFDLELRIGAGAFVCGEETASCGPSKAAAASQCRVRPSRPARSVGQATNINNVETWPHSGHHPQRRRVVCHIRHGENQGHQGLRARRQDQEHRLVEVPFGTPLRDIIYEIGGGVPDGKQFKAVQSGGPSGGVIPAQHLDTPVEYETLQKLGSIMGSGGMVIMDEDSCNGDVPGSSSNFAATNPAANARPVARHQADAESAGEKSPVAKANSPTSTSFEDLCNVVRDASLCGLGQTAPNPC